MVFFKCKMCGGTVEFEQGATVGACDSCGTKQTLPRLDDDKKANLYDRANHFRRNNEYDKAMGIYEQILAEDNTDAEAYWSLVLCRYGIEYVEDPATHKRVPTVNRAQYMSVSADEDYKSALKYADAYQRAIYEQEAKTIDEIQKGILEISSKEEPFDIFISYKETDESGRRTPDSVLANDLYHQLTNEGFKVFFSRITLEDKLGTAYEPYIFSALNSAKVMVVIGTKPEYFNAVWVKNEWSRYLALVKKSDGKKMLIPAYRDMDPYDLPEEFSHLQAQDMSKLGFMQDLIRGIKKIVQADEPKPVVKETVVVNGGSANVAPLLKRVFMFLEDSNWEEADEYCEKVLDQDPENAQAYLGKLMAELKVRKPEQLADCKTPFDKSINYQKVMRFGDEKLAETLTGHITHIKERNEYTRQNTAYEKAVQNMNSAKSAQDFAAIRDTFKTIPGFKNADELAEKNDEYYKDAIYFSAKRSVEQRTYDGYNNAVKQLSLIPEWKDSDSLKTEFIKQGEECRKDSIYNSAKKRMSDDSIYGYEDALKSFSAITGWKDSDTLAEKCKTRIEECQKEETYISAKQKMTNDDIEGYNEAIQLLATIPGWKDASKQLSICKRKCKKKKRRKGFRDLILVLVCLLPVICGVIGVFKLIISESPELSALITYKKAVSMIEKGNIIEAYENLISLGDYRDSKDKAESIYEKYKTEKNKNPIVGNSIFFGKFEQDNNDSDGKEDIEWLVLAKENNKVFVVSKYALSNKAFNDQEEEITWKQCSLRKWLNSDFLESAFTTDEQKSICETDVSSDIAFPTDSQSVEDVSDKIFLLSYSEVEKFFKDANDRKCTVTEYAKAQGASTNINGFCYWYLRSRGQNTTLAELVYADGSTNSSLNTVAYQNDCVRPAMWVSID